MEVRIIFIISLFVLGSCNKKEIGPQCPTCGSGSPPSYDDVLIGCEGNFGWGNASLSIYNPVSKEVNNSVFSSINGFNLGDVFQSISEHNGLLYLTVDNSNKIEIIDTLSYTSQGTITGFTNPRYFKSMDSETAYVSELWGRSIKKISISSSSIIGSISTNQTMGKMEVVGNYLFACATDTNILFIINTLTDQISNTIHLDGNPNSVLADLQNNLWILTENKIYQMNPQNQSLTDSTFIPDTSASSSQLTISRNGEELYFLNHGVQQFEINSTSFSQLTPPNGRTLYGLGYDQNSGDIYVSDAKDYVQPGSVYRYDSSGLAVDTFSVGIIPQSFWFK